MSLQRTFLSEAPSMPVDLAVAKKIKVRALANDWISKSFPTHRKHLLHTSPKYSALDNAWTMSISTRNPHGQPVVVGNLVIDGKAEEVVEAPNIASVQERLRTLLSGEAELPALDGVQTGHNFEFRLGDGIAGANSLPDRSIDLLLTDPPYGISKGYTCESQVPRRLRKDGTDFIMPKGNFGDWDTPISPSEWTQGVLPKVRGWFVTFCAQAQIGEYSEIL